MKKMVVIIDYVAGEKMRQFQEFEKYGFQIEYVYDHPEIQNHDAFSNMFLQFEKHGPDSLPVNEDMVKAMEDADIVVSHLSAVSSKALRQAKNLDAVCIMRSGVENVDLKTADECGVKIVNIPGRLAVPVSEFTIGMMIAEMKNIARSHNRIRNHNFEVDFVNNSYSWNLAGKAVGLIGCGLVGSRVAKILKAFDAEVLVFDPYLGAEKIREMGCEPVELDELCERSDVISVHYRLTDETKGMIGAEQFAKMKPTCCLINTARAGLVEEQALIDALTQRKIGGAALYVFHQEPLPEGHPFYTLENVTLTAHLAGTSADIFDVSYRMMRDTITSYLESGTWSHVVNMRQG